MNTNAKIAIVLSGALVLTMIVFLVIAISQARTPGSERGQTSEPVATSAIRDDTRILDNPGETTVTVVEFLDFECEACGAFYPIVEQVREEFAGQITFAVRYFPMPGHFNSANAAIAVEAAARQGELEAMYSRMFETQIQWGEAQESHAPLFRQFAEELGLDMEQYDADVADPATAERVQSDFDDGLALGVTSTPTFFINDRMLELSSFDDLQNAIDAELGQ